MKQLRLNMVVQDTQPKRVDRENHIIHDVVAMVAGVEATGHGLMSDMRTLELMVELGNNRTPAPGDVSGTIRPIRQRLGHPGISENVTAKTVAVAKNFRIVGDKLIHDSHLIVPARKSPAYEQDPIEYIMDMAEFYPAEIGESVVIWLDAVWKLADGRELNADEIEERPPHAINSIPLMRPVSFEYVDYVSEGALTHNGLFSKGKLPVMLENNYAEELFLLVDQWRDQYGIAIDALPKKVNDVMQRYLDARKNMSKKLIRGRFDQSPDDVETEILVGETDETDTSEAAAPDPLDEVLAQQAAIEPVAPVESDPDPVIAGELQVRLENLEAANQEFQARLNKALEVISVMSNNMAILAANQKVLEGEPIVRTKVRATPAAALGELGRLPDPPASVTNQQPNTATRGGSVGLTKNDLRQRALNGYEA